MRLLQLLFPQTYTRHHKRVSQRNCLKTVAGIIQQVNAREGPDYYDLKMAAVVLSNEGRNVIHPVAFCVSVIQATRDPESKRPLIVELVEVRDLLILLWGLSANAADNIVIWAKNEGFFHKC